MEKLRETRRSHFGNSRYCSHTLQIPVRKLIMKPMLKLTVIEAISNIFFFKSRVIALAGSQIIYGSIFEFTMWGKRLLIGFDHWFKRALQAFLFLGFAAMSGVHFMRTALDNT